MYAPRVAVRACPGDGRNRVGWMERYGRETTRDVDLEPLLLAALRQRFSPTTVAEADLEYVPFAVPWVPSWQDRGATRQVHALQRRLE